jgi:hypothetical protein
MTKEKYEIKDKCFLIYSGSVSYGTTAKFDYCDMYNDIEIDIEGQAFCTANIVDLKAMVAKILQKKYGINV